MRKPSLVVPSLAATAVAGVFAVTVAFVLDAGALAQDKPAAEKAPPPAMTAQETEIGKRIYFERCAGCHGVLRKGATGKNLEPHNSAKLGQRRLETIIALGTDGGMVNFDDILTKEEIATMAKYLQHPPDVPPEWGMKEMMASWKLIVPPEKRPKKQMNRHNLANVFSVTLRDSGEVALIDGDTKEIINIVKTGYAVHISRVSYSGRYIYTIGRDGLTSLIDLWMEKPDVVATLKAGIDARSVDTSKFKGFEDKYAIVGTYWPPQYVITEGDTLKPLKIVSTRGITVDGEYHPEPRVASIVSSHIKPEWVVNIKETGMILLVDYSDIRNLKTTKIEAAKFLHDGGWDASKRYFLVAANAVHKIAAVDTRTGKLAALIDTKRIPHPGRGANFFHPKYGPVWATGHLGDAVVTLIGTPSEKKEHAKFKGNAWKVVEELKVPGAGNLFVKTHPKSTNLWVDLPQNPERELAEAVFVFDLRDLSRAPRKLDVARDAGLPEMKAIRRAVHPEYNNRGDEVWISVWAGKTDPSAIVVYDDRTLKVKSVIRGPRIITPTGKFNVYNTQKDVY
jgi:nitrite reductase (NO-forming)/hydroxylamine reductase